MQVHKLTSTRLITSNATNDEQHIFTGSTFNRLQKKSSKEAAKKISIPTDWETVEPDNLWTDTIIERCLNDEGSDENKLPGNNARINTLSNRSKDKLRNKIESLFRCSEGFTLATLSFINTVTDRQGVKCLNKFLTVLRKRTTGLQYIWVAERQENGNIHFHVITNKFLKVSIYNALWVMQQYNEGIELPGFSHDEMIQSISRGTLQKHLNPFDIKQVKTVEGLAIYLTMYVTKNNSQFDCATWYCSRAVSALFTGVLVGEDVARDAENTEINWTVNKTTGEVYEAKAYVMEYAVLVSIFNKKYFNKNFKVMDKINKQIMDGLLNVKVPTISYLDYDTLYNEPYRKNKGIVYKQMQEPEFKKQLKNLIAKKTRSAN